MDTARFVGVDVTKQRLDVAVRPSGEQWSVGTDPAGLAQLVERLTTGPTPLVVCEATGGLERALVAAVGVQKSAGTAAGVERHDVRAMLEYLGTAIAAEQKTSQASQTAKTERLRRARHAHETTMVRLVVGVGRSVGATTGGHVVHKILFLASNPTDTGHLRLDKEQREIDEGLKRSNRRDSFELVTRFAVRISDLRRGLLDHSPRIVHFSGHGEAGNGILVENDDGTATPIPSEALAELFGLVKTHVECVILNACYSEAQASAIGAHIRYVIGMTDSISDHAALEFAVGFYDALGAGRSIADAFAFGRNAIALKGTPEHLLPTLREGTSGHSGWTALTAAYSPASDVHMEVSVLDIDASSWTRGQDMVLRYAVDRTEQEVVIRHEMGYMSLFNRGGPLTPLDYLSPTLTPFLWDFPSLDFKILNNRPGRLFLTEVVLDIEESQPQETPLFTIWKDTHGRRAGYLVLRNEGCDLAHLMVAFNLLPGKVENPTNFDPPFAHSIPVAMPEDNIEIELLGAFAKEGVDVEGLLALSSASIAEGRYVVTQQGGAEIRLTRGELDERWESCLGAFKEEVGTLVGQIGYVTSADQDRSHTVSFHAPAYLANANRVGIPRPPTFSYDVALDVQGRAYRRRVQISQVIEPGDTDRFTIKTAVARSSQHRLRATVRDVTGMELDTLPVVIDCFVPRSSNRLIDSAMSRRT